MRNLHRGNAVRDNLGASRGLESASGRNISRFPNGCFQLKDRNNSKTIHLELYCNTNCCKPSYHRLESEWRGLLVYFLCACVWESIPWCHCLYFHIKMQIFVFILLLPVFKLLFFNLFELRQFLIFFCFFSAITIVSCDCLTTLNPVTSNLHLLEWFHTAPVFISC